jgi:tRNA pseudouridine55 synthase
VSLQSGLLLINKPGKVTSHDVVNRVRRALNTREVGHAGTLDPMATGLLVLLLGEATKISDYVLTGDKGYRLKVQLGVETDTLDMDGQILHQEEVNFNPTEVSAAADSLVGDFNWPVPNFSAVKKDGKKLYEMARNNEVIEAPVKEMKFWALEPLEVTSQTLDARITCSKGSYIRTWASQFGKKLGTAGTLSFLQRTYSQPFELTQAIDLEDFEAAPAAALAAGKSFVQLSQALPQFKSISVKGKDERLLTNGQVSFDVERRLIPEQKECNRQQKSIIYRVFASEDRLLALIEIKPFEAIRVKRVFKTV